MDTLVTLETITAISLMEFDIKYVDKSGLWIRRKHTDSLKEVWLLQEGLCKVDRSIDFN